MYLILVISALLFFSCNKRDHYDLIILNGSVYDGTGASGRQTDIGIINDKIVKVGNLSASTGEKKIYADGMVVSPGFIDLHAHLGSIIRISDCENLIRQGVTTALGGSDGGGPWPFKIHLDSIQVLGSGINIGFLAGHNVIRKNILKLEDRSPTTRELELMKYQVKIAMEEGAFGISTGLKYLPGAFSEIEEIIELSKVAAAYGGFYTSHLRDEGLRLLDAVNEAIIIGRVAEIPVVLTHHKIVGQPMWGSSVKTLAMVDSARAAGQDVMLDQYPYTASRTGIGILIPSWAKEGGNDKFAERISDKNLKDSIKKQIVFNIKNDRGGSDLKRVLLSQVSWNRELDGKTLYDWCELERLSPTFENGAELIIKAQLSGDTWCVFHAMDEDDVIRIIKHPYVAIASDGVLTRPEDGNCHPRAYGTFPRVLSKYVRDEGILSLEEAIRKMTSLPAARMGLKDRGLIKEGYMADIVIFDPERIKDKNTFSDPHQFPEGIEYVLVNGNISVDKGNYNKYKAGRILYGPGVKF